MHIVQVMERWLGRSLDEEETAMLAHLSSQGMAKINGDLIQGVDPEMTLAMLRMVYRGMERRREETMKLLAPNAKEAIAKMSRPLTTEEMIFVNHCLRPGHAHRGLQRFVTPKGTLRPDLDALELQHSAMLHLMHALSRQAHSIALSTGAGIAPCQLVSISCPEDFTSPTFVRSAGTHRLSLGLSPIVTWFDEAAETPLEVSAKEATFVLGSSTKDTTKKRSNGESESEEDALSDDTFLGREPSTFSSGSSFAFEFPDLDDFPPLDENAPAAPLPISPMLPRSRSRSSSLVALVTTTTQRPIPQKAAKKHVHFNLEDTNPSPTKRQKTIFGEPKPKKDSTMHLMMATEGNPIPHPRYLDVHPDFLHPHTLVEWTVVFLTAPLTTSPEQLPKVMFGLVSTMVRSLPVVNCVF